MKWCDGTTKRAATQKIFHSEIKEKRENNAESKKSITPKDSTLKLGKI